MGNEGVQAAGAVDEIGLSLMVLVRAYHSTVAAIVANVPHGPRGYQTLASAVRGEQPSQLAIATDLGIDRTVMTYLIDDLVKAGLVERRLNPADRRQRKIVPTELGARTYEELRRQVREAEDKLLEAIDPDERISFRDLLGRISSGLRAHGATCTPPDGGSAACFRP
ncbi:MarR family winged helix-turn-helix transcriptional regulator [Streptomyces cellulosae]|uniref:MarR family winged helix-turn-helix transcriptional regulator n=1 Tax=Streptomyces cellulosae TaxID=1968 RepID=UPI0007C716DE|nr:MarR family winged helix-turn-helix transcriptional regulator [Streptomyces cellulosae]